MWLIPPSLGPYIFIVVVALVAVLLRRRVGWGWLIVACLGLSVLMTGLLVIWVYRLSPLSLEETHTYALLVVQAILPVALMLSGMAAWLVALIVPPRTAPDEGSPPVPPGGPEDTHELLGLPRRYQALLTAHREARQRAVVRPSFRAMFRPYVPSYVRQDLGKSLQGYRASDLFRRDFVAAASVVTKLSEMPTAQLSVLEAYHRVNLRRVRRHLTPVKIVPGALLSVALVASRALPSSTLDLPKWDEVRASILGVFSAQPPSWAGMMWVVVGLVLGWIAGSVAFWGMQRRLEAFGELLTVALAQRRLEAFDDTVTDPRALRDRGA
jgi:hypothetical protein